MSFLLHEVDRINIQPLIDSGVNDWFNMDILAIARLLNGLPESHAPLPERDALRLSLLAELVRPELEETTLADLYAIFIEREDWMAASAAAGAAIAAVWDSGYDFRRFDAWLPRVDFLLQQEKLSPLAQASLAGFKANALMNGCGNLSAALNACHQQIIAAEKARSIPLRIFHGALKTYIHLWDGQLSQARVLLQDTMFLLEESDSFFIPVVFLQTSRCLYYTLSSRPEKGRAILQQVVLADGFDLLPLSVWLLVQANLLFALAHCNRASELQPLADKIRQRVIPEQNAFHHSFIHFSLGVAELALRNPGNALAHAEQAVERGLLAYSAVTERMPLLLKGQALIDLGREDEVRALFEHWIPRWQAVKYRSIAVTAAQEMAYMQLHHGNMSQAIYWYEQAVSMLPSEDVLPWFHRPDSLQSELLAAMLEHDNEQVLQITCLGELRIKVGGKFVYDHKWRGGRSKTLLKALIVFGGNKVSIEQLSDLLWPDMEGDQAYKNLKVVLWRLRRLGLEEGDQPLPWLQLQHGNVSMIQDYCHVDVFSFSLRLKRALSQPDLDVHALKQVLDLYTGDFLANDMSETWIIEYRERLRRRYLEAVLLLVEAEKNAQPDDAIMYLYRALEIDPLDERIYASLMGIYIQDGYPSKALEVYHSAKTALKHGLDIKPGTVLVALAKQAST